jgi:hypothetical protein
MSWDSNIKSIKEEDFPVFMLDEEEEEVLTSLLNFGGDWSFLCNGIRLLYRPRYTVSPAYRLLQKIRGALGGHLILENYLEQTAGYRGLTSNSSYKLADLRIMWIKAILKHNEEAVQ